LASSFVQALKLNGLISVHTSLDVGQTFPLRTALASVLPAERIFPVGGPNSILLLVIYYDLINRSFALLISVHLIF
jgi:hypothetical protein